MRVNGFRNGTNTNTTIRTNTNIDTITNGSGSRLGVLQLVARSTLRKMLSSTPHLALS